jgi:hypothetical protein
MRSDIFFLGIFFLALGAVGLFYFYPDYQRLSSIYGQIGMTLSPQLRQQYFNLQIYLAGSIIAAILGFGLVVHGASKNPSNLGESGQKVVQTTLTPKIPEAKKVRTFEEEEARAKTIANAVLSIIGGAFLVAIGWIVESVDGSSSLMYFGGVVLAIVGAVLILIGVYTLIDSL